MTRRAAGWLTCMLAIGVSVVMVVISCQALFEAYGPGPPYYSRTTSMDKWSNPVPVLLVIDGLGLFVVAFLIRLGRRLMRAAPSPHQSGA